MDLTPEKNVDIESEFNLTKGDEEVFHDQKFFSTAISEQHQKLIIWDSQRWSSDDIRDIVSFITKTTTENPSLKKITQSKAIIDLMLVDEKINLDMVKQLLYEEAGLRDLTDWEFQQVLNMQVRISGLGFKESLIEIRNELTSIIKTGSDGNITVEGERTSGLSRVVEKFWILKDIDGKAAERMIEEVISRYGKTIYYASIKKEMGLASGELDWVDEAEGKIQKTTKEALQFSDKYIFSLGSDIVDIFLSRWNKVVKSVLAEQPSVKIPVKPKRLI